MESYYILIVAILFVFAISDLIVGVCNDAVNFLNSAIGSRVAPFKIIMFIAALGILFGATFSSGMMEVARKGIFHPDQFYFSEIMIIFLAVMMTDILLLDFFNTFALPTSTTVSIVFELLGAAVAISVIKIAHSPDDLTNMSDYINTANALVIILGILLSVVIAFTFGAIIQYLVRIFFTFRYHNTYRRFSSIWGGIAITIITYFILIKGARGSSFLGPAAIEWIGDHVLDIILISLAGWTVILQVLMWLFKTNILKVIVLVGTFALAMAFAGNDLVNFIGVPLAGFESFKFFQGSGVGDPGLVTMESLKGPIKTPTIFLLMAGLIMVGTLWRSRKARSVTATELDLSRQEEGYERFESSLLARVLVRISIQINNFFLRILPDSIFRFINKRFDHAGYREGKTEKTSFDLVRASVNLVVASALIAFGTSMKLPLSTTYVTFTVAMGTSLADRAWGRESAVYRISGVVTVIGGWFFTALCAFTASFLMAWLIHAGGLVAILLLLAFAIFILVKSNTLHKKRDTKKKDEEREDEPSETELTGMDILSRCSANVISILEKASEIYDGIIDHYIHERRKKLKKDIKKSKNLQKETFRVRNNIYKTICKLQEDAIETGHYYVQVIDYLKETVTTLNFIAEPVFNHIDNNHPPLIKDQIRDITEIRKEVSRFYEKVIAIQKKEAFKDISDAMKMQGEIIESINKYKKKQLKRIKKAEVGTKNSLLFLTVLNETKNLMIYAMNLLTSQKDFLHYNHFNSAG